MSRWPLVHWRPGDARGMLATTKMAFSKMHRRLLALVLPICAASQALGGVTPELLRQIRASTFEVVMKKPADDSITYEKPLPLELLPYVERTDPYRSIGTAFAIGKNAYVTAAHVLAVGIESQYGAPAIRAADGTIHPIANIEKFSAFEDFVVFSLKDDVSSAPLPINRSPHVDDPVLAVGNALGEGIIIRDGLFTSETPEQQDGRWKWIRFSAAASPGNSGGPLLDASGSVVGVVIAKSPNENLNYALPIANVLDAPQSKAQFDQRVLTELPFAQGSKTYTLQDEFALPLSWDGFVRASQTVARTHSDKARAALLSAYASTMFPRGSGTESILYGGETASREPEVVTQQSDGNWTTDAPEFQFTDLAGDGRVGVATAAGAVLLALHRGSEASDSAFYTDSKSFMDVALKALNLRRTVGTDQVKVVSLGPAVADVVTSDEYGRKWQLRVWPVPFQDVYLVAQLLPTPDGYFGLIEYVPSAGLREAKIVLSMLSNQVTLTYSGTLAQWREFLSRRTLLPDSLKDVKLESGAGWKLHTGRFDSGVPPDLMKIDLHSKLLMYMNYGFDGPRVIWDIGGVRWCRDAQEKAYVELWRKPRPPSTAKLELRTRFDDLQGRRSPYDGLPVQSSSDSFDVATSVRAPGTKQGLASSDVIYALSLRIDGRPSPDHIGAYQAIALQATLILEHGIGQDVAASTPATVTAEFDALLKKIQEDSKRCDAAGRDIRGRACSEDVAQYIMPLYQAAFRAPVGSAAANDLKSTFTDRARSLEDYWRLAPGVVHNRDLWRPFLSHNHLSEDTSHDAAVQAAESTLNALFGKDGGPADEWVGQSEALNRAYVDERRRVARKLASDPSIVAPYRARKSTCPAPAVGTSGTEKPRPGPASQSLADFYPRALRVSGVEGLVVLSVRVNTSGCATEAAVIASSGSNELDEAAMSWVETASFLPAEKGGKPVEGRTPVAVNFALHN
jgi:serine protease Do